MQFRLFLAFFLSIVTSGCKKSSPAPSQQAKPAATPAPTAVLSAPAVKPTPPLTTNLTDVAVAKSFQVHPPALFSGEEIPPDGVAEFFVTGQSGQFLQVEVNEEGQGPSASELVAQAVGSGELIQSEIPEYCRDEQLYPLNHDGKIRVVYNPGGRKSTLKFTLLDKDDPLVNVGVRPEQVSVGVGSSQAKTEIEMVPYDHVCEEGESWPASVILKTNRGWFHIARVEGYKKVFPKDNAMQLLSAKLQPGAKPADAKDLPYANWGNGAATVMTARPELIQGEGWKGWRWVEGSSQDGDYPGGLSYVFEGLTDDGVFFIRVTGEIEHSELKRLTPQISNEREENQDTRNRLRLERALATAEPSSFTPNINELDAIVRSLKLKQ